MYSQQKHIPCLLTQILLSSWGKDASQSPLSSWDETAERKLGEIYPLKAPVMLNNLFFPPSGSQKLHMAGTPESINPSCLEATVGKTGGSKQPLETVCFVTLILLTPTQQKLSRLIPNSAAVPPKSTAKFTTWVLPTLMHR